MENDAIRIMHAEQIQVLDVQKAKPWQKLPVKHSKLPVTWK